MLAANVVIAGVEVGGGLFAHSMALLADAGHNAADVLAAGLALGAVHLARRPPTRDKSFGYHRGGVLAAQANAAGVLVLSVLIAVGAVSRLVQPEAVHGGVVAVVAAVALACNAVAALVLARAAGTDLNMRATVLHMGADAAASAGVLAVGLVLLGRPSLTWLDPAVSVGISLLVGAQAVRLTLQVIDVLFEGTPSGTDVARLGAAVATMDGVEEAHDLHVWALSPEVLLLSAHLVMAGHPSLEEAQAVAGRVRATLAGDFGISHATLELECETCTDGLSSPCAMEPAQPETPATGRSHP